METTVKTFVPLVAEIEVSNTTWAAKHGEDEESTDKRIVYDDDDLDLEDLDDEYEDEE